LALVPFRGGPWFLARIGANPLNLIHGKEQMVSLQLPLLEMELPPGEIKPMELLYRGVWNRRDLLELVNVSAKLVDAAVELNDALMQHREHWIR
jgi:hypothetical protein